MAVKVVLAFLGKKLDGAEEARAGPDRFPHGRVGDVRIKDVRLTSDLGGRVGIGIGDEGDVVQCREPPVHGRVRG